MARRGVPRARRSERRSDDPRAWLAAIAAALAIDVLGGLLVTLAISLHQGHPKPTAPGAGSRSPARSPAATNACFALVAVHPLRRDAGCR